MLTGIFFILMPGMRIGVEFVKNSQGGIENSFGTVFSTGQLLSFPFYRCGNYLDYFSSKKIENEQYAITDCPKHRSFFP